MSLRRRFEQHLHDTALLRDRAHILVAVSGGLDSIVLLHLLRFGTLRFKLTVAHYDHAMRSDSARDALWLRGLCRVWNVPLISARTRHPPRTEAAADSSRGSDVGLTRPTSWSTWGWSCSR